MSSNTGDVSEAISGLGRALDRLVPADLAALSDAGLVECMRALRPLVCRVQAVEHRLVGLIHTRGAASVEGAVSTAAWLRNGLRMPEATTVVQAASALSRLPAVAAAFAAGDICDAHVATIAKVARDIAVDALVGGAEELLLAQARELTPTRFQPAAVRIRDTLDPEAADRRRRERLESRWLSAARTFDGCVSVSGLLDPEAGELFLTALGAVMPPPRPEDARTAATRRADALLDLCRLAANHAPVAGGQKPHVVVTVDLESLRDRLGRLAATNSVAGVREGPDVAARKPPANAAPRGSSSLGADTSPRLATLGSGWPIGVHTARRLACDADVIPMLLGSASEPLDVGRLCRTTPPALRRALVYRDGGCRFPFCDRPAEWTDAHHGVHWVDGGPTALWNLVLLCRPHHVQVHELGWLLAIERQTGKVTVRHPSGRPLGSTHGPHVQSSDGDHCYTSNPRGPVPVRGAPPGTIHRTTYECGGQAA